jgi:hypothetical protein
MSWTINFRDLPEQVARKAIIDDTATPQTIKDYLCAGIDGLVELYGNDVRVSASSHGHLCYGQGSYGETSASIILRRAGAS